MSIPSPSWHRLRRILFWFRLALMLCVAGFVIQLSIWNRDLDPRFFRFLGTPPGKMLARVMNWPTMYDTGAFDKNLSEYSEEELKWRDHLLSELQARTPSHLLTSEPTLSWRDVRLQMDYPTLTLSHSPHFSILSDAPFHQIATSVEAMEHLRSQYLDIFSSLVRYPKPDTSLQLLYFSNESDYREHQQRAVPLLENSIGYYSPLEDRLVLFNHQFSDHTQAIHDHVQQEIDFLSEQMDSEAEQEQLDQAHQRLTRYIQDQASIETLATLRHEGAHYLSYTYGVHSWIHTENAWLIEGIATYFEAPLPGQSVPSYLNMITKMVMEDRLPTLANFMAVRLPSDFATDLPQIEPHEAYALSWSLFRLCMSPPYRASFFEYVKDLQEPKDLSTLMKTSRVERLAAYLSVSSTELEAEWQRSLHDSNAL